MEAYTPRSYKTKPTKTSYKILLRLTNETNIETEIQRNEANEKFNENMRDKILSRLNGRRAFRTLAKHVNYYFSLSLRYSLPISV